MSEPLFSVIIPAFNRSATIRGTLCSVSIQACSDFEIIVVDDGSTDGTVGIVRSFPSVRLIQQANGGPGAARNAGAAAARGEYLAFLDSDDIWFPWTLEVYAELIREFGTPALLSGAVIEFTDESELLGVNGEPRCVESHSDFLSAQAQGDCYVGAGVTVVRRAVFMDAGGFTDEIVNCEDHDVLLRLGLAPGFVRVKTPATVGWRRHAGGTTQCLQRTVAGVRFLLQGERNQRYPGGRARRRQRRSFLTSRMRPVILECVDQGDFRTSWRLFLNVLAWHIWLGRWKFIAGYFWRLARAAWGREFQAAR